MINKIKRNLISDSVALRIITTYICFLVIFIAVTILSYYLLPQGFLRSKHPLQNWNTSPNLGISTLQIFAYNLLSVILILLGNIFSKRKNKTDCFRSLGYNIFFIFIALNAVVLGTWSFEASINSSLPLLYRIIKTFDLFHTAALWEMSGQIFILCATIKIALIITDGKETITRNWKSIKLSKQEIIIAVIGLILMLIGAFIESSSIINLK